MTKPGIICIGNAAWDQIFLLDTLPTSIGKFTASGYLEAGGGPAATASVTVSRLGGAATLWSRTGDDSAGDKIVANLRHYGVNADSVLRAEGVTSTLAGLFVDRAGERLCATFVDSKLPEDPAWLPLEAIQGCGCVLGDIRWNSGVAAAFRAAKQYGVPSVLDGDMVPKVETLELLAPLADHAVFSENGLKIFSREETPEAGLRNALSRIPGMPYVTLGDKGCMWLERDGTLHHFPAFTVAVVDTTGAGDVFHGAFALAVAEGMPVERAVRFASGAAALKCTKAGGRAGIPTRAALEEFLAS